MKGHGGFDDWEILLGSEAAGDDLKPSAVPGDVSFAEAIQTDHFALDRREPNDEEAAALAVSARAEKGEEELRHVDFRQELLHQQEAASAGIMNAEEREEEGHADSDVPSWVDPESDSRILDRAMREAASTEVPDAAWAEPWSNELNSGRGFRYGEGDAAGGLVIGESVEGDCEGDEDVGAAVTETTEGSGTEIERSVEEESAISAEHSSSAEVSGDENVGSEDKVLAPGVKGRVVAWWKLTLGFLKLCASKVKPRWSIYLAAAVLGIWLLSRRMHSLKVKKKQRAPSKIRLEEQKASPISSLASLNESLIAMKRDSTIRPSPCARTANNAQTSGATHLFQTAHKTILPFLSSIGINL